MILSQTMDLEAGGIEAALVLVLVLVLLSVEL